MIDAHVINKLAHLGVLLPEILIPQKNIDMSKWSVVACDQYTSSHEYWEKVKKIVGSDYSTYHITLPEIYLEKEDVSDRISKINKNMQEYLNAGILQTLSPGLVLVKRTTHNGKTRKGIIIAVDLEMYDYSSSSTSLIRATEGTVVERIPPRLKVRENAAIECPHVMLLIDDPEKTVIEPLFNRCSMFDKIYDFELMMNGGRVEGFHVCDDLSISAFAKALDNLADVELYQKKYNVSDNNVLLFAVGDGNHSLATAKAHWEKVKCCIPCTEYDSHPARYALAEVVNLHDDGLVFEPIHRVLFNCNVEKTLDDMSTFYNFGCEIDCMTFDDKETMDEETKALSREKNCHIIKYVTSTEYGLFAIYEPPHTIETGTLQYFLDEYIAEHPEIKIDYIHGEDCILELSSKPGNIGFLLPSIDKNSLFKTVINNGVLPRKSFSMGEADEKRFYLECRKIVP